MNGKGLPGGANDKQLVCQWRLAVTDAGLILGLGKSPGGGHGNPLQYSCLENPMDRGDWQAAVHRVTQSWAWLKQLNTHALPLKVRTLRTWTLVYISCYMLLPVIYMYAAAAAAKSLQSCPTLWDPIDGSPPSSPVPGILQVRILEWVAISFSNAWKWKVKSESEVAQSGLTLSDPMDYSLPGSSIHGIFQARELEWGAIAFSHLHVYFMLKATLL